MSETPVIQPSLLVRLRDSSDDAAWSRFVEIYAPLVYGFARKHGMQDADVADMTQEVLCSSRAAFAVFVAMFIRAFRWPREARCGAEP